MEANTTEQLLISIVEEASGIEAWKFTLESTWEELGMDSLDFIQMINEVREHVGPISEKDAANCGTVRSLLDYFSKRDVG